MAQVRGFNIPEDRFYWVEKHTWARPEEDGTVTNGITNVVEREQGLRAAGELGGRLVHRGAP